MKEEIDRKITIPCVVKDDLRPEYQTRGAAGADLKADLDGDLTLGPGKRQLVPTGLRVAIPQGYEGQIRPRSGLAVRHGITLLNAPGTIDSDYRGEIKVVLINLGGAEYVIKRGDRIAQLVVSPVMTVSFAPTESIMGSERGDGGFGSTGVSDSSS